MVDAVCLMLDGWCCLVGRVSSLDRKPHHPGQRGVRRGRLLLLAKAPQTTSQPRLCSNPSQNRLFVFDLNAMKGQPRGRSSLARWKMGKIVKVRQKWVQLFSTYGKDLFYSIIQSGHVDFIRRLQIKHFQNKNLAGPDPNIGLDS